MLTMHICIDHRFLTGLLTTHVLYPELIPPLLLNLRTSLFPQNALAPGRPSPSLTEQCAIKRRCATALLGLVPKSVAERLLLGSRRRKVDTFRVRKVSGECEQGDKKTRQLDESADELIEEVEKILDVYDDAYCNKHLIYGIVELCILKLVPEVGEMGVRKLMDARLGEGWEKDDPLLI